MESRPSRTLFLAVIAGGVVFGILLEAATDPFEEAGLAWIGLVLGTLVFGGVCGYWYRRTRKSLDEPDERLREIERRGSRLSHGALTVGLAALALVLSVPWVEAPVAPLLWALLVGSLAAHELSVEYYRRRM